MHLAKEALEKLPVSGIFIVGAQDIRTETGKLYPLGMLIMEDVIRAVGEGCLKLKELSMFFFVFFVLDEFVVCCAMIKTQNCHLIQPYTLMTIVEAVPDGYQKDRRKITNWGEFKEEPRSPGDGIPTHHLPIVHVSYPCPLFFALHLEPGQRETTTHTHMLICLCNMKYEY